MARLRGGPANTPAMRRLALGLTIGLPLFGAVFLIPYLKGIPFGKAPPDGWLILTVSGLVFGLAAFLWWWSLFRTAWDEAPAAPSPDPGDSLSGLIVYPDALVHVQKGQFTVIHWQDVQTLEAPPSTARCWRITARDGRHIDLPTWIEDDGTAIAGTVERVTAVLAPRFLERIEAGKKVMFGPFGFSKRFVYFKDKKADWDDVTSMRILTGRGYSLQIFCGGILPWCDFHLLTAPNGQVVYEVIRRAAPERLLKPA